MMVGRDWWATARQHESCACTCSNARLRTQGGLLVLFCTAGVAVAGHVLRNSVMLGDADVGVVAARRVTVAAANTKTKHKKPSGES